MAHDASVKEVEALYGFSADMRNIGESIAGRSAQLSILAYQKEDELRVYVGRIETALEEAEEELSRAEYEYENYVADNDRDDYSESEAWALRAEVEDARVRCDGIREDLDLARMTFNEASAVLSGLMGEAKSFSGRIGQLSETAAHNIDAAAFEITQYKNIR